MANGWLPSPQINAPLHFGVIGWVPVTTTLTAASDDCVALLLARDSICNTLEKFRPDPLQHETTIATEATYEHENLNCPIRLQRVFRLRRCRGLYRGRHFTSGTRRHHSQNTPRRRRRRLYEDFGERDFWHIAYREGHRTRGA